MERVAVVIGKMHSGGKKNLIMEYYRHIDRTEIQFDFICDSDSNSIPIDEIKQLGGKVFLVPPYQHIFKNMAQMKRIFKTNRYNIEHSYNGTMNLFSLFVGWQCNIPIRISESISMGNNHDKKNVIKNLLKPFSKLFATDFIANGEMCGKWQFGCKFFDSGRVKVFKTIINTDLNKYDSKTRSKTRKEYNIEENIVIGHIGRLTEQKNSLFLIDIFNEIVKKEPLAKLLIIGDGNLRELMFQRISNYSLDDKVLYLGRREDIQKFYNAMDCFLLPSLYEGLPVVGVEAQCTGLPVFFSKEISRESSVCDELGFFIGLDKSAKYWANVILKETKINMAVRRGREQEAKTAGFDSVLEANRLSDYYNSLIKQLL
jgi:glycosyltransferase involved in cell wall biosynthesis